MVFMGTIITSGSAIALVTATSFSTEFGKTFQEMKEIEVKRTPLQVKMDELGWSFLLCSLLHQNCSLGKKLSLMSFAIIFCIGFVGIIQGKSFFAMFNIGVSLAVAAIPEGLPICVTVTLALGVMRMAKRKAIVKKLPAVEALGCADYLCCDKTGTLTQNKMSVQKIYCPAIEESFFLATSVDSSWHDERKMVATYNGHLIDIVKFPCLEELLESASLCNNAQINEKNELIGQPTELALLICCAQLGVVDRRTSLTRIKESNFSSETKTMEVTYQDGTGKKYVVLKGKLSKAFFNFMEPCCQVLLKPLLPGVPGTWR